MSTFAVVISRQPPDAATRRRCGSTNDASPHRMSTPFRVSWFAMTDAFARRPLRRRAPAAGRAVGRARSAVPRRRRLSRAATAPARPREMSCSESCRSRRRCRQPSRVARRSRRGAQASRLERRRAGRRVRCRCIPGRSRTSRSRSSPAVWSFSQRETRPVSSASRPSSSPGVQPDDVLGFVNQVRLVVVAGRRRDRAPRKGQRVPRASPSARWNRRDAHQLLRAQGLRRHGTGPEHVACSVCACRASSRTDMLTLPLDARLHEVRRARRHLCRMSAARRTRARYDGAGSCVIALNVVEPTQVACRASQTPRPVAGTCRAARRPTGRGMPMQPMGESEYPRGRRRRRARWSPRA